MPLQVTTYDQTGAKTNLQFAGKGAEINFGSQPSDAHGGAMLLWGKGNATDGWRPDGADALLTWRVYASAELYPLYFSELYGNTAQHAYFDQAHKSDLFAADGHILPYQAAAVPDAPTGAMIIVGLLCIGVMKQRRRSRAAGN